MFGHRFQLRRIVRAGLLAIVSLPAVSLAQTTRPESINRPLLQQLNSETQALFQSVKQGIVRVELPPRWIQRSEEENNPFLKWNTRLNAEVRQKLRELQARFAAEHGMVMPTPSPSTQPDGMNSPGNGMQAPAVFSRPEGGFTLTFSGPASEPRILLPAEKVAGVILDQVGHVLLPVFVEKEAIANRALMIIDSDGEQLVGRLIGSDRQTGLTVLQLDKPTGKPLLLTGARPQDGSLLMLLTPSGDSGRLSVWTGESQDWGMVIAVDGSIHGFLRGGHFLCADSIRPLAEELVRYGVIRRATLGVLVMEVESTSGRRALRVERVSDQSAAAAAGMKEGDLICSFAGTPVTDFPNFSAAIAESNGNVDLMILREGHPMSIPVQLRP